MDNDEQDASAAIAPGQKQTPKPSVRQRLARFLRELGAAGPLALTVTVLPALGAAVVLSFGKPIAGWLASLGWLGLGLFIIAFAILGGFALVTTYSSSLIGGYTFKFLIGFPAVMLGLAGAAMISYALAQTIVGHRVENLIHNNPRAEVVRQALIGRSTWRTIGIIILVRLSPMLPFETTNVLLAMCGVRPVPFFVGSMIGITPRAAAIVYFAAEVRKLRTAPHPLVIIGALVLTLLIIAILALIGKHALDRAIRAGELPPKDTDHGRR